MSPRRPDEAPQVERTHGTRKSHPGGNSTWLTSQAETQTTQLVQLVSRAMSRLPDDVLDPSKEGYISDNLVGRT